MKKIFIILFSISYLFVFGQVNQNPINVNENIKTEYNNTYQERKIKDLGEFYESHLISCQLTRTYYVN